MNFLIINAKPGTMIRFISKIIIIIALIVLIFDFFFADDFGIRHDNWYIFLRLSIVLLFLIFEYLKWKTKPQSKR